MRTIVSHLALLLEDEEQKELVSHGITFTSISLWRTKTHMLNGKMR